MKEIIITSSVLILCIILIRVVFKGKISSRLQYALWFLVVLRLLIPTSAQIDMAIGSLEKFRIMDLTNLVEARVGDVTEQLDQPVNTKFTMSINSELARRTAEFVLGQELIMPVSEDGPTSIFVAGKIAFSWLDILRCIWIGGMLIVALWMFVINMIFTRKLHKERKEYALPESEWESFPQNEESIDSENIRKNRAMRSVKIYTIDGLASPCLYGMPFREAVYLTPDIAEDRDKLRHVLTHEICHKKHGDSFWSIVRSALLVIYWMNPLVWAAAVLSKRDCELACDEAALLVLGEGERISYGETLLSIITRKGRLSDIACTATTMTGSGRSVKERIRFIAKKPRVLGVTVVAVLVLAIMVSVLAFTKSPLFRGDIWEGEATITAGDLRIKLPATVAGISSYDVDKDGSIVIYQVASGKEVGRYSTVSFGEAVTLLEEGREVIPLGYYGKNPYLLEYLNRFYNFNYGISMENTQNNYHADEDITTHPYSGAFDTTHTYRPNPGYEEEMADVTEGVSGTDSNNDETTYILEDYEDSYMLEREFEQQKDLIEELKRKETELARIREEVEKAAHMQEEVANAARAAAGMQEELEHMKENVESIDYQPTETEPDESEEIQNILPDESIISIEYMDNADYLINEQIDNEVSLESRDAAAMCYIYVTGDFAGIKTQYLDEMNYINNELKAVSDRAVVLSINREIRTKMLETLAENRTEYLGAAYRVGALVSALQQPGGLQYTSFTLHTLETDPETALSLDVDYRLTADGMEYVDEGMMCFNALMLFATIKNVDTCNFVINAADRSEIETVTYYRADLEEVFDSLWSDEAAGSDEDYVAWLEFLYSSFIMYYNNNNYNLLYSE